MQFSVLMSIYRNGDAQHFDRAVNSIWDEQTAKPNEIVLVADGPLTDELDQVVNKWKEKLGDNFKTVPLEKNVGLGKALNVGLSNCSNDLIARMDTDDICLPNRFKDQIDYMLNNPDVDVAGTWTAEIDENNNVIKEVVKYPETHKQCLEGFICRNPMSHPTVMFRKSFFDKAGNYPAKTLFLDDDEMWHKGFISGCVFANVPKVCLQFRRASDFYLRRQNVEQLAAWLRFRIFTVNTDMNHGIRGNFCALLYFGMQLLPSFIKKVLYNKLR